MVLPTGSRAYRYQNFTSVYIVLVLVFTAGGLENHEVYIAGYRSYEVQNLAAFIFSRDFVIFCLPLTAESGTNEGLVRIQYKSLVPIYVLPEMKTAQPYYF
jgi:hypothetical protein